MVGCWADSHPEAQEKLIAILYCYYSWRDFFCWCKCVMAGDLRKQNLVTLQRMSWVSCNMYQIEFVLSAK